MRSHQQVLQPRVRQADDCRSSSTRRRSWTCSPRVAAHCMGLAVSIHLAPVPHFAKRLTWPHAERFRVHSPCIACRQKPAGSRQTLLCTAKRIRFWHRPRGASSLPTSRRCGNAALCRLWQAIAAAFSLLAARRAARIRKKFAPALPPTWETRTTGTASNVPLPRQPAGPCPPSAVAR